MDAMGDLSTCNCEDEEEKEEEEEEEEEENNLENLLEYTPLANLVVSSSMQEDGTWSRHVPTTPPISSDRAAIKIQAQWRGVLGRRLVSFMTEGF